jgi:hypothetical protein
VLNKAGFRVGRLNICLLITLTQEGVQETVSRKGNGFFVAPVSGEAWKFLLMRDIRGKFFFEVGKILLGIKIFH